LGELVCPRGAEHRADQIKKLRLKAGIVEWHDARAERLLGLAREAAACGDHRHSRWAQLRIKAVDISRRRHGELAGDRGKGGVAPHRIGKMLESDGAELEREPDQIGKAELRAGEVVPAGLRVLRGNAISCNLDALDLLARDVLVIEKADERLERGLDVPAAGIGLDVAVRDAKRHRGRECDRTCLLGACEGLHETVALLDHPGRTFDTLLRQERRLQSLAGGVAGVQPLDVAAPINEGEQAGPA